MHPFDELAGSDLHVMEFFRVAVAIGCDEATKTRNRLVRTPNAIRVGTAIKQFATFVTDTKYDEKQN